MAEDKTYPVLDKVNYPDDIKELPDDELVQLCDDLRQFIIDAATVNPGHLGANLGVVELTVALHRVFNVPEDKLIFDVGHQAYGHKILTGRKNIFSTNRKYHGISGFPCMAESCYDSFGTGHSSTSISAALGMAVAAALKKEEKRQVVAVIGDGALCGGMAFEALNNAGAAQADMLVVLNDNRMAIDPAVGALSDYLLHITTSETYNKVKDKAWNFLGNNSIRQVIQRMQKGMKATVLHSGNLFEALHFRYFGPVDGHDVKQLVKVLNDMRRISGPKLLHVLTVKGKGYAYAEKDQVKWHAPQAFDKPSGEFVEKKPGISFSEVFGRTLVEMAAEDERIVAVTPAMAQGSGLHCMQEKYPERTFDVGIAEQHAVTFAAGMASQGLVPFCSLYSTFLQRAYDQIIHDVALQRLHVVFVVDRAGITGSDGATHHGAFDLAALRCIPNLTIASPSSAKDLRDMLHAAVRSDGPFVIRYPKQKTASDGWQTPFEQIETGRGRMLLDGDRCMVLALGPLCDEALRAAGQLPSGMLGVCDMRFLKPLDETLLGSVCTRCRHLITLEDGTVTGGLGSAVEEYVVAHGLPVSVTRLGMPDRFVAHGTRSELLHECGCDAEGILSVVSNLIPEA